MSKDAVLKLSLKSNSGYSCQQTANIDVSQWGAIQGVISGNHVFLAALDLLEALIEERRTRLLGQQPDVHWESLRDARRDCYAKTDAAIAKAKGETA